MAEIEVLRGQQTMSKLKVSTREIGSVCVFDLVGEPTPEGLQEVSNKIQRNIRRHRIQRVILNLQMIPELEPLGLRKLLASCIRPQRSLLFGVSKSVQGFLDGTYVPKNMKVCSTEKEVAEDFGPFLLDRTKEHNLVNAPEDSIGRRIERRRSKRMHVALPIDLKLYAANGKVLETHAIATNISEGGLFAEYLDLEAAKSVESIQPFEGLRTEIVIFPSANFPEEYHLEARIVRRELRKKQIGLAVEFVG